MSQVGRVIEYSISDILLRVMYMCLAEINEKSFIQRKLTLHEEVKSSSDLYMSESPRYVKIFQEEWETLLQDLPTYLGARSPLDLTFSSVTPINLEKAKGLQLKIQVEGGEELTLVSLFNSSNLCAIVDGNEIVGELSRETLLLDLLTECVTDKVLEFPAILFDLYLLLRYKHYNRSVVLGSHSDERHFKMRPLLANGWEIEKLKSRYEKLEGYPRFYEVFNTIQNFSSGLFSGGKRYWNCVERCWK